MTVDRQKVLDAFAAYIRPYDAQDPKVSLKIHHTYRVAALCEQIGRSIALEGTALDLAWLCGMLHDVGRFEQLRRFGTFDDSKSIDHARAGVQVLFEQGHIRDYLDDDFEDAEAIKLDYYGKHGALANNFDTTLPATEALEVKSLLKDPYIFDMLTFLHIYRKEHS